MDNSINETIKAAWQSDNGNGTYTNPILNADYPDIAAIRVGKDFYMVSSTFVSFPSIPIMHSRDLVNWEIIGYVTADLNGTGKSYTLTNSFEDYGHGCWAPTIAYRNGVYYVGIYQAQGKFILCTSTNPAGPYTKTVFNQGFHDPALFLDDDGTGYIISEANDVKISKLSGDYKSVVNSRVSTRIEGITGKYLVEGTHIIKKNGYYYIFRNSTPPESYTYCLRSKNIYGPYEMRILLNGPRIPGGSQIHQGGPIDTPTGEWWFYVFQDGNGLGRRDILVPMQWQNDWPVLGDPSTIKNVTIGGKSYPMGSVPITYRKPDVGASYPVVSIPDSDEFNSSVLGVQWQWNHYPDNSKWSLGERPGYLRLRAKQANNLWRATNTLTQRVQGPDCQGTIELDTANMADGDQAGLCLLNIPYGSIGVVKSAGIKRIVANINAKEDAQGVITNGPELRSNTVYLRANANLLTDKAVFSYSTDNVNFTQLGGQLNMPFDLGFFQGDKFGIYNFNTASAGGYVDVNWFRFVSSNKKATGTAEASATEDMLEASMAVSASGGDASINLAAQKQLIRGYGGINHPAWIGDLTAAQRETAFGNGNNQLGFSILRIYIDENKNNWSRELATAKKAKEKGALLFASPWNPPSDMAETFTRNGVANQKRLRYDKYGAYAQHLNDFVTYMKNNGVELYAISVQNEPDYAHTWTWWTPTEMLNFMKNYAGSINCKVIAPESFSYMKNMSDPILNDSQALANMDILGAHLYGTPESSFSYPLFKQKGANKELWMTEVYYPNSNNNSADLWPEALEVSYHIHNAMVLGDFQAYVWWYIRRQYGPMKEDGTISKRGYNMAHFSKFVRPGYVRVDASANPSNGVYISAYKGDNKAVIVAINKNTSAVSQKFTFQNGTGGSVSSWITDGSRNLAAGSSYSVSGNTFTAQLPARSVTTFVTSLS